jgi:hypothetical protein
MGGADTSGRDAPQRVHRAAAARFQVPHSGQNIGQDGRK